MVEWEEKEKINMMKGTTRRREKQNRARNQIETCTYHSFILDVVEPVKLHTYTH